MRISLLILLLLLIVTSGSMYGAPSSTNEKTINFPGRSIKGWSLENAVNEARSDINQEKIKIYYSGTIAASPIGVEPQDLMLIRKLPIADAGMGCVIENEELRKAQFEYGKRYNEIIVQHLKELM